MMVMPANSGNNLIAYLAGKYPGQVGHLYSERKEQPRFFWPYALDNGCYAAWKRGVDWDEDWYFERLEHYMYLEHKPLWVAVPDVVSDKEKTLELWDKYAERVKDRRFKIAFVAQDDMTPYDVPLNADVVFIGGSTEFKLRSLPMFCAVHERVHVGRVNIFRRLVQCAKLGVESVDGCGFGRGGEETWKRLTNFLAWQNGELKIPEQAELAYQ